MKNGIFEVHPEDEPRKRLFARTYEVSKENHPLLKIAFSFSMLRTVSLELQ